jgi:hypothetical protein
MCFLDGNDSFDSVANRDVEKLSVWRFPMTLGAQCEDDPWSSV